MGKIIIPHAVERKPGFIYYIDGSGNICEAESAVGKGRKPGTGKKAKKTAKKQKKEK